MPANGREMTANMDQQQTKAFMANKNDFIENCVNIRRAWLVMSF